MASVLQLRGGSTATVSAITIASREVLINTDTNRPHVGDGSTAGGHVVALLADVSAHPGTTNLSGSGTASVYTIASDTGTNATIPAATNAAAGVATAAQITELEALRTNVGNSATNTNLGTFTGVTIQDNRTVKQALQDIETEVEDRLPDFVQWQRKDGGYYFGGSTPHLVGPDIPSFTDGTDDLPFSVVFTTDVTNGGYATVSKLGASNSVREWSSTIDLRFGSGGEGVELALWDTSGNFHESLIPRADILSIFNGSQVTIAAVYTGSTAASFATSGNNITLYVNGEAYTPTVTNNASYSGMSDTTQPLWIGRGSSTFATRCSIKDVRLFNRALSASDVAKYSRGEATAFSDRVTSTTALTSGTLTVGKRYRISSFSSGDSFTNVGAGSNATGVEFVATGTTPTTWTNGSSLILIGEVASYLPESSEPNRWLDVTGLGRHATNVGATHLRPSLQETYESQSTAVSSRIGTGPGYYFDGTNDFVQSTLSLGGWRAFTFVLNFNSDDVTTSTVLASDYGGTSDFGYTIGVIDNLLYVDIADGSTTNYSRYRTGGTLSVNTNYCAVIRYNSSGVVSIFINGKNQPLTAQTFGSGYTGSVWSGSNNIRFGRFGTGPAYYKGSLFTARILNRAVTDAEAVLLSRGQRLGFADRGATGTYSYFSNRAGGFDTSVDGWANNAGLSAVAIASGISDGTTSYDDVLALTSDATTGTHRALKATVFNAGKRYRVSGKYYVPSANTSTAGVSFQTSSSLTILNGNTTGEWTSFEVEFENTTGGSFLIAHTNGTTSSFTGTSGDLVYVRDLTVTPIGEVLSLLPSGAAPTVWADQSGNGYNGSVTSATLINPMPLHADAFVSLTNLPTSSAGLATGRVWNDSGTLKVV